MSQAKSVRPGIYGKDFFLNLGIAIYHIKLSTQGF